MHTHVKTSCIILKPRRGAEVKKVRIKQQKSLFDYQQKISKHPLSTFDHHEKIYMSESWNTKTEAKFHYFHHRKFENLHLQPLPPNNPNLFPVSYLRFLDDEGFYEKMLKRQLCKKSLCCLPPNLNKF